MVYMPFAELVDIAQEIERLKKEEKKLEGELARVNGMLSNEKFVSKAPATSHDSVQHSPGFAIRVFPS